MKVLVWSLLVATVLSYNPVPPSINRPPYFVAMEYKGLLNCIYKVYVTDSLILGAKVNGYITVQPNFGIGHAVGWKVMHIPDAYVNRKMDSKYENILADYEEFMKADKQNFIIRRADVKDIFHDPTPKWGMGYYPHTGKIIIQAINTVKNVKPERELILVGDQNPKEVLALFDVR
ncbi:hypothetical protein ACX0G9_18020 [Flavitalea flava]